MYFNQNSKGHHILSAATLHWLQMLVLIDDFFFLSFHFHFHFHALIYYYKYFLRMFKNDYPSYVGFNTILIEMILNQIPFQLCLCLDCFMWMWIFKQLPVSSRLKTLVCQKGYDKYSMEHAHTKHQSPQLCPNERERNSGRSSITSKYYRGFVYPCLSRFIM